jgi:hypothetical protein
MTPKSVDDDGNCSSPGIELMWRLNPRGARRFSQLITEEYNGAMMASREEIESARLIMLDARKALEEYQDAKGFAVTPELKRMAQAFAKAAEVYRTLSTQKT